MRGICACLRGATSLLQEVIFRGEAAGTFKIERLSKADGNFGSLTDAGGSREPDESPRDRKSRKSMAKCYSPFTSLLRPGRKRVVSHKEIVSGEEMGCYREN